MVILHSFAGCVEQLCARAPDAPSIEMVRPKFCAGCGEPAQHTNNRLRLVGHGMYSRQVRGLSETGWIVIWVRRFLCLACGRTISRLPDWLHPWRWYGATVIMEALYRNCILQESARLIGARLGRPADALGWRSPGRWRSQLLMSPTLWGWLGPRLGISKPAADKREGRVYVQRLLAEAGLHLTSPVETLKELATAVRRTLQELVHNRKDAGKIRQFPAGQKVGLTPGAARHDFPTEKGSSPEPP
jgi:uncharacterized protein DUF6431